MRAPDIRFLGAAASISAALTEDITDESDIVAGGNVITITLTGARALLMAFFTSPVPNASSTCRSPSPRGSPFADQGVNACAKAATWSWIRLSGKSRVAGACRNRTCGRTGHGDFSAAKPIRIRRVKIRG